jgi:hypothetical protein
MLILLQINKTNGIYIFFQVKKVLEEFTFYKSNPKIG